MAFLLPAVLALVLFRFLPVYIAVDESLRDRSGALTLETYRHLFTSPQFVDMLQTTLVFNALINPIQVIAALGLALLLNQRLPGTAAWRTIAFAPTALPVAVSAIVWNVAFRSADGPINAVLEAVGLPAQPWLTSPDQAMWAIIIMASWVGIGYWMVFLLAALQEVPRSTLEAAAIDGAGYWRALFHIVLPQMRRQLAFVLIATTIVNFLMFAPIQIMTSGGPTGATNLIMYSAYTQAYRFNDPGLAAAHVVIVMALLLVIVSVQFVLMRARGEEG
jgi:multiple sugar transport system permease protein